jgi:hypothetical protein
MNISEGLRELRRRLSERSNVQQNSRRQVAKPQQLEFSLPQIRRSRLLRLNPNAVR